MNLTELIQNKILQRTKDFEELQYSSRSLSLNQLKLIVPDYNRLYPHLLFLSSVLHHFLIELDYAVLNFAYQRYRFSRTNICLQVSNVNRNSYKFIESLLAV